MKSGSYDGARYTEYNGTTYVTISWSFYGMRRIFRPPGYHLTNYNTPLTVTHTNLHQVYEPHVVYDNNSYVFPSVLPDVESAY